MAIITATVPEMTSADNEVIAFSFIFKSLTNIALGEMPNDAMTKAKKTNSISAIMSELTNCSFVIKDGETVISNNSIENVTIPETSTIIYNNGNGLSGNINDLMTSKDVSVQFEVIQNIRTSTDTLNTLTQFYIKCHYNMRKKYNHFLPILRCYL